MRECRIFHAAGLPPMKTPPPQMPEDWQWLGSGLALLVLVWAVRRLPWHKVQGDGEAQRTLAIFTALMILMRGINTHALDGVSLHFLGAAIATLMFGPRFALLALALVSGTRAMLDSSWHGWGWDFLVNGALPISVTFAIGTLAERLLPAHIFIYVMVNAFFAAALSMASCIICKAAITALLGADPMPYLIAGLPLSFGEAFFTGGTMALIVAYRPQWCASFDDEKYLKKRD